MAFLAFAVWLQMSATPSQDAPLARPAPERTGRIAAAEAEGPVKPLKLDALHAPRQEPGAALRNPFRFEARAAPPPPPRPATPEGEVPRESPRAPTGPPPLPPIPLKFIGSLERANGVKWAILSDGKNTMHGRDGDIIEGRYRIVKIGAESIEMSYLDGRGRQTIRLTGQ